MNLTSPSLLSCRSLYHAATLLVMGVWLSLASFAQEPETGALAGYVSNQGTGDLLRGANVEFRHVGRSVRSDDTGRFVVRGLAAGEHEVVASYAGLDPVIATVTIRAGVIGTLNFELKSTIYRMGEFKVSTTLEGAAASLTAQKNANNVKNVISLDSYGDLPNLSVAELAGLMPGVAVNFSDDGVANGIQVRGAPATLNRVTIDGGLTAGAGVNRQFPSAQFTGAGFAEVELTKGHRPDTGADSLGGTVNLKSRSPLSMMERRRVDYTASVRYAPPFTEQVTWRQEHRTHPMLNLGYQEVFDVAGGARNLGISFNTFYSENANGLFVSDRFFQNTTAEPAYLYDYRVQDKYNNRKIFSGRFLADYRLSPATTYRLIVGYVHNNEPHVQQYTARIFTAQSVGTTGNAGILPGYTDRVTEARVSPATQIQNTDLAFGTYRTFGDLSLGADHKFDRLTIDYTASYSWNRFNRDSGKAGGILVSGLSNIGWMIDRTQSELSPRFVQTGGPDVTNPVNYRPITNGLTIRNQDDYEQVKGLRGSARLQVTPEGLLFVKGGFDWREVNVDQINRDRRFSYIGTAPLQHDTSAKLREGLNIPHWHPGQFVRDHKLVSPELWSQDAYFHEQLRYTGTRSAKETVTAAYAMADGRLGSAGWLGRTNYIAGVRMEKTETEGRGFARARILSNGAAQIADPAGAAARDYAGNARSNTADYTKYFPSAHLAHDFTANWKGRVSWSTSFGRPNMSNMFPTESPNEVQSFVTVNNPGLLPQDSRNWDANLDYYFKPAGYVSVGWFHKTITDYIVSGVSQGQIEAGASNGFNGEYSGFDLRTSVNAGTAKVKGWEFSYQQQFTFLPGLLKGLSVMANYTVLETEGDFGGTTTLSSGQVAGFIPRTANFVPGWRYGRFSTRVRVSYASGYLFSYNAANPALNVFTLNRVLVSPSVAYELRPSLNLTCEVSNIFHEFQSNYTGLRSRVSQERDNPITVTFGVKGRF